MTPSQRLYQAVSCAPVDRVSFLPKIWVDLASRITGIDLINAASDPAAALRCVPEAASKLGIDAARLFQLPERNLQVVSGTVVEIGRDKEIIGTVDMQGGLATLLEKQASLQLSDPYVSAHQNFWVAPKPLKDETQAVQSIAVPSKSYLHDIWGQSQRAVLDEFQEKTALVGDCSSIGMAFLIKLRGMQQAVYALYDRPSYVHALLGKGTELAIEKGKFHCDMGLRVLRINDSAANMSVLSPDLWREYVYPQLKTICSELHRYEPDVRLYCHICGNIEPVLEDLADTGIDCIGPMDPLGSMDIAKARRRLGTRPALMGGINTLSFLSSGVDEVIEEAKECLRGAGPLGFVLGSGCALPRDSRLDIIAAIQELVKTGKEKQK